MKATALRLFVLAGLAALFIPTPAHAAFVNLTGTIKDQNGAGIPGVQINFVDSCTDILAGATGNITSATGTFSATVIAGIYDLDFHPPVGSLYAASRILKFDLTASRSLGVVTLANGVTVSGRVTDTTGAPIMDVYLHFFLPTGRVYTVLDKTDASGNYSVVVVPGTYDLRYGPHSGTPYQALSVPSVAIPGNITLPTVALQTGLAVSGTVLDSVGGGQPVINVNINAVDTVTGASVILSHDRTDANGLYSVVVPPGSYFIQYEPLKCTLLAGLQSAATSVSADTTMPTVNLPAGVVVKGLVTDTGGAPVFDVNTDYFNGSGVEVIANDDHTDATGAFSTVLVPGTYSMTYSPPRGLRLAGVATSGVVVNTNPTTVPTVRLPTGFFVSGRVVTSGGATVPNVEISFFTAGTSTQIYVSHNSTDTAGSFSIVSVQGTYDILFTPPATTCLAAVTRRGVVVASDTALSDTVLLCPAPTVSSIMPGAGTTAGGQSVTVSGTGFRALASLTIGGLHASVLSISGTAITATTPARPVGITNVTVTNSDGQSATLPAAYAFQEPAVPIVLTVTRSGNNLVLTWTSTGQASYTVFGSNAPNVWTDASILTRTALTTYTVVGGALTSGIEYFSVE